MATVLPPALFSHMLRFCWPDDILSTSTTCSALRSLLPRAARGLGLAVGAADVPLSTAGEGVAFLRHLLSKVGVPSAGEPVEPLILPPGLSPPAAASGGGGGGCRGGGGGSGGGGGGGGVVLRTNGVPIHQTLFKPSGRPQGSS